MVADLELDRPDIARAAASGDDFLNVRRTHFEIVTKKSSRLLWRGFPAFDDVLNCEIRDRFSDQAGISPESCTKLFLGTRNVRN